MAQVSPDILGTAAIKLTRLELCDPTSGHIGEIFIRLPILDQCANQDISHISPPKIVSEALLKLKNLYDLLCFCLVLSSGQISHLMTKISDSKDWRLTHSARSGNPKHL